MDSITKNRLLKGTGLSLVATILMSFFPFFYQNLGEITSSQSGMMLMFLISLLLSLPTIWLTQKSFLIPSKGVFWIALVALSSWVGNWAYSVALSEITPAVASNIKQMELVFVTLLGSLFLKEKFTLPTALTIVISFLGLIILRGNFSDLRIDQLKATLTMLLSSLAFSLMLLFSKIALKSTHVSLINGYRLLLLVIVMPFFFNTWNQIINASIQTWLIATLCSICGPMGARYFMTYALNYISMTRMMAYTMLAPVLTALWQWWFLGNGLSLREWVGALFIILGTSLMSFSSNKID